MNFVNITERNRAFAQHLKINPNVSEKDFIFKHLERRWGGEEEALSRYFETGRYSASLVRTFLDDVDRVKKRFEQAWLPTSILDFAAGYGCVARHLQNTFPGSDVLACDIHQDAIVFNEQVLGVRAVLSSDTPEAVDLGEHDLVFALSFFTHMPRVSFARWIKALSRAVRPGGVLLFTANGYATEKIGSLGLTADETGFAFKAASEQQDLDKQTYGATISTPTFVFQCMRECRSLRLHSFKEAIWWNIQDAYTYIRDI